MRFAAAITLYNPSIENINNIKKYENCFELIFLFDNSNSNYTKVKYNFSKKFVILSNNNNVGLSYAFNEIIKDSRCYRYDFLCTLDQDSIYECKDIKNIKEWIELNIQNYNFGMIGPYIDYNGEEHIYSNVIEEKSWIITSGAFINLNIIRKEKIKYDINYFIDRTDIDICKQILEKKYKVLMFHGAVLHQRLGENIGNKHSNHSSLRHYYIFRNRLYYNKKWYNPLKRMFLDYFQTLKHLLLILLYENNKKEKCFSFFEAYIDYKNGRFGKKISS